MNEKNIEKSLDIKINEENSTQIGDTFKIWNIRRSTNQNTHFAYEKKHVYKNIYKLKRKSSCKMRTESITQEKSENLVELLICSLFFSLVSSLPPTIMIMTMTEFFPLFCTRESTNKTQPHRLVNAKQQRWRRQKEKFYFPTLRNKLSANKRLLVETGK